MYPLADNSITKVSRTKRRKIMEAMMEPIQHHILAFLDAISASDLWPDFVSDLTLLALRRQTIPRGQQNNVIRIDCHK
jgi:hypothetical protein